jgi:hypothetical protein
LFGPGIVVKIEKAAKIDWIGEERFLCQKKIVKKNLGYCNLNKNKLLNKKQKILESNEFLESFQK